MILIRDPVTLSPMPPPSHISAPSFWQWAYSDHLSNANRGVLAEYIVGCALNAVGSERKEWDRYDLVMPDGVTVEVKSSAYLQTWEQKKPSTIVFDIARKSWWDAATNTYATEPERSADVYVLCVFKEQDRAIANPLDLSQWDFLVCATKDLNVWFGDQKSVRLEVLLGKGLTRHLYEEIAAAVEAAVTP